MSALAPPARAWIIAAATSGAGKTTLTAGLLRALARRGVAVRAAKSGPDYIDPGFHAAACGQRGPNLDSWAMRSELLDALLHAAAVQREDYEAAMREMAKLRPYVDAFFDKVTVNVAEGTEKKELRENRLKLLNQIRVATEAVADFSCIEG